MGANSNFCAQIFDYFLNLNAKNLYIPPGGFRLRHTGPEVVTITENRTDSKQNGSYQKIPNAWSIRLLPETVIAELQ
ncbi:hypothetical protein EGK14_11685 [Erwinia sp. 198]|nr:hypothetical protein EGK14_11685 [Erwinia sp. 198]